MAPHHCTHVCVSSLPRTTMTSRLAVCIGGCICALSLWNTGCTSKSSESERSKTVEVHDNAANDPATTATPVDEAPPEETAKKEAGHHMIREIGDPTPLAPPPTFENPADELDYLKKEQSGEQQQLAFRQRAVEYAKKKIDAAKDSNLDADALLRLQKGLARAEEKLKEQSERVNTQTARIAELEKQLGSAAPKAN